MTEPITSKINPYDMLQASISAAVTQALWLFVPCLGLVIPHCQESP